MKIGLKQTSPQVASSTLHFHPLQTTNLNFKAKLILKFWEVDVRVLHKLLPQPITPHSLILFAQWMLQLSCLHTSFLPPTTSS